jgi:hypothetical protein
LLSVWMKAEAYATSPQAVRKLKNAVTARPGRASGMITRQNVANGPQPSIAAASSSEVEMESKYPLSIQAQNGTAIVRFAMMSEGSVLMSPRLAMMT